VDRDAERGRDEQMGGRLTKGVSTSGLGADLFLSNEVGPEFISQPGPLRVRAGATIR
jgi:acyl dehydratase